MKKVLLTIFILFILIQIPVNSNENVDIILVNDIKLYEEYGFKDISLVYKRESLTSFDMPFIVSKTGDYNELSKNDLSTEINYEKQKDINIYNKRVINLTNNIIAENENYYVINYHMDCKADNESFKIDLIPSIKGNRYTEYEWWSSSWQYKTMITIQHEQVDDDLQDFPIRIYLNNSNENANDILSNSQNDLDDIAFTDETETVQLAHEIEDYITGGTNDVANIWVRSNVWASNDTIIYCYYGNPEATNQENIGDVWTNYEMVHHMNGANEAGCDDSTDNNHDVTSSGGTPAYQEFENIGYSIRFAGASDYLSIPDDDDLSFGSDVAFTISAWVNYDADTGNIIMAKYGTKNEYFFYIAGGGGYPCLEFYDTNGKNVNRKTSDNIATDTWKYLTIGYNGNTLATGIYPYIDGSINLGSTYDAGYSSMTASDGPLYIGKTFWGDNDFFNGHLDELRISRKILSDEYISTDYNTMNSPSTFYEIGNIQSQPSDNSLPNATSFNPINNSVNIDINNNFSCYVYDDNGDKITYKIEIVNELFKYITSNTVYNSTIYYNFTNCMFYGWNYVVFVNLTDDNVSYNNYIINYRTKIENENSIGESMEITLGINFLGIILMLAIFLLGFWADQEEKKNIWKPILMFLDTPIALALAINYISNSMFSVGWWIGVILFCFAIILSMAGLYYGLNFGRR